jgi:hypothetical protein
LAALLAPRREGLSMTKKHHSSQVRRAYRVRCVSVRTHTTETMAGRDGSSDIYFEIFQRGWQSEIAG